VLGGAKSLDLVKTKEKQGHPLLVSQKGLWIKSTIAAHREKI
jgi:hypothetical protein